ncbi:MAG: hypothetical protein B6D58_08055 [candidate division Zixibacteria bacterium 4484_95]|nr:MAG: hypothetical protein B6D58_08055 [candidate division Zixibacteria bacterium 4484_95]RKX18202.1 MAG: hypothetical protein DRP26_05645 [candidate division Zixibacteria bacterium]
MNKKDHSSNLPLEFDVKTNPFALGTSYLDYCVHKGWLEKTGDGPTAQYILTETGKKKLSNASFNLDLSTIASKSDGPKKRRKRHKK